MRRAAANSSYVGRRAISEDAADAATARELYRAARFSEADAVLERVESGGDLEPGQAILRARVFLVRDPARTLTYLNEHWREFVSKPIRAEGTLLRGAAYARLGDHASAAEQFKAALALSRSDAAISSEVRYQQALSAWMQRKLDTAENILSRTDPQDSVERVRIQRYVLQGAISASRGDMTRQGAILLDALAFIRGLSEPSVLPWAYAVSQVSYLARELHSSALRDAAYVEVPRVPWTEDLADTRFTALRAIGWCHALEGDYFNAFRRLKEAALVAPTPARRVMSLCDRAYLARCIRENRWAEQERNDARELAATVNWRLLDGEERFALCLLAELFAEDDATLALAQIAEYRRIGKHFEPLLASADDRRVAALEAYSFGVVQRGLGETSEAVRLISEAYEIYSSVQYRWRAGRAAQVLAELTGEAKWNERAKSLLSVYPRSWLFGAIPLQDAKDPPGAAALTAAQRTVYDLLAAGLTVGQIAEQLGRSEFTIRNHVKAIFKALNVKSRASLIALATRGFS